jgi:glutathione peroxidase
LYAELTLTPDDEGEAGDVKWNFEKFLVGADGQVVTRFRQQVTPEAPELLSAIESALPA